MKSLFKRKKYICTKIRAVSKLQCVFRKHTFVRMKKVYTDFDKIQISITSLKFRNAM